MKLEKATLDINTLVRKNVLTMKPYSSARDEFKGEADIFLDANENPYPSPYNRYPDPLQWKVKEKLAPIKKVRRDQIFLGNGSDEAIDLVIRAFCEPGADSILITDPTYGMYAVCADVNAVNIQRVTLTTDFDLDLDKIWKTIDPTTKVIFLCSPNNPTGNLLNDEKIKEVMRKFRGLIVIDEAYIDFSSSKSFAEELDEYPNLIVLQTFSKAWGLAGLRLGMAFASRDIINILNKIKYPYNVNIQTQDLALKTLAFQRQKEQWVTEIIEQRKKMEVELSTLSITKKVYHSDSNFLLVQVNEAVKTYQYLMNRGIIVRDRSNVTLCNDCLRITIGTPAENVRLLKALKEM
ncbi:MAG TPA: histidinol-phosphate transaminase [Chryseolinea sp.]